MSVPLLLLAGTAFGDVKVVVEMVPDNPGPYTGGESLTVDVWLHSEVSSESYLWVVQLDFTDSDPGLILDPTFTFDLSSSGRPQDFEVHRKLPIPWTANLLEYACPPCRLQLPAGGSLHIGSIAITLPTEEATYRLDALNADDPDFSHGGEIREGGSQQWRAFTGEITGGSYPFVVVHPVIPTTSEWSIMAMSLLLLVLGSLMIIRRTRGVRDTISSRQEGTGTDSVSRGRLRSPVPLFALICAGGVFLGSDNNANGQAPLAPVETVQVGVDSGIVSATGPGSDPVVVFSRVVEVKDAPWVRLRFGDVRLSGGSADGNESSIRITSLGDGAVQVLDSYALGIWQNTSAYFNGDRVLVELLARPNTETNRIMIDRIAAGAQSELDSTSEICGADDRVPSGDPRAGRFRFQALGWECTRETWCTAFLYDDRPNCMLSAGHCCAGVDFTCGLPTVVEFNVPLSDPDGTINYAHPDDQYPVDQGSVQFENIGLAPK